MEEARRLLEAKAGPKWTQKQLNYLLKKGKTKYQEQFHLAILNGNGGCMLHGSKNSGPTLT